MIWALINRYRRWREYNRQLDELAARIRDPRKNAVPSPVAVTVYADTPADAVAILVGGGE